MALTSKLVKYDAEWILEYEKEEKKLKNAFGEKAIAIYHVGSTSIPNLTAKPEIDLLVVIKHTIDVSEYSKKLVSLGYDDRGAEPGEPGHWYYSKNQNGKRTHKLHLCTENHKCIGDQLIFRNYLRDKNEIAKQYEELKLSLEQANTKGIVEYLENKTPFIENVINIAKAEGYKI